MDSEKSQAVTEWRLGNLSQPDGLRGDYPYIDFQRLPSYGQILWAVRTGFQTPTPEFVEFQEIILAILKCDELLM